MQLKIKKNKQQKTQKHAKNIQAIDLKSFTISAEGVILLW